jgi:CMP-N,N'-diacetyllegionaminic acid synthase
MKKSMKAIIPVRGGSKRVQNKNSKPFCGTTLLQLKIRQLLEIQELDGVCVNSEDPELLDLAKSEGAETYLRDSFYASDTVPMSEVYAAMVEPLACEHVLYATVTTPFLCADDCGSMIQAYHELAADYDSIHTATQVRDFLVRDGVPMNYDPKQFPRSQDLPDIKKLVFGVAILPRLTMIRRKSSLGEAPLFYSVEQLQALDIDTPLDFEVAEWLYRKRLGANIDA